MNPGAFLKMLRFLNTPQGRQIVRKITSKGGDVAMRKILQDLDPSGTVTDEDVLTGIDFAKEFTVNPTVVAHPDININENDSKKFMQIAGDLMRMDPKLKFLMLGLDAVGTGIRAFGDAKYNNKNALASALLEATRDNTEAQDNRYGKTSAEKAGAIRAQLLNAEGKNIKNITDGVAGVLDRFTGATRAEDAATRHFAEALATGQINGRIPGALYDRQARQVTHS